MVRKIKCLFVIAALCAGFYVISPMEHVKADSLKQYDTAKLIKLKTTYIGNHNKVIRIVDSLPFFNTRRVVSLQTKIKPYGISVSYYGCALSSLSADAMRATLKDHALVMFALIDNVDVVEYNLDFINEQVKYRFTRVQLQQCYEKDIRAYTKDTQTFDRFLASLGMKFTVKPTKYALTMSSTPGIQMSAQINRFADKIVFRSSYGKFFRWDHKTGKMTEYAERVELPLKENEYGIRVCAPVYWSPLGAQPAKGVLNNPIKAVIYSKNTAIAEKQININYDGTQYYTVDAAVLQ